MEITLPHPQAPINQQTIMKSPKSMPIPNNKSSCKKIVTVSTSTSSSSVRIELPLQRPQHKQQKQINKAPQKRNNGNPFTGSTISDILRLLDCLKIPVSLELYGSFIQECTKSRDPLQAIELHNHIRTSHLRPTLSILNRLLLMYISCDCVDYARQLFDMMFVRSPSTWAAMIAGYFESGDYEEVIDLFVEMRCWDRAKGECSDLDKIAVSGIMVCVLKACAKIMSLELGKQIHGWIIKIRFAENLVLSSSLMSFYGKVGCFEGSDYVFGQVPDPNKVIWTAKLVNYCNQERFDEAIDVFREMGKDGVKKNGFTVSSVLKACASMRDGGFCGQQVHATVIKSGLELNEHVQCGLINMYGKRGLIEDAREVFNICGNNKNIACWNAMLTGCIQQGFCTEAIKILYEMKAAGLQPQESLLHEVMFICGSNLIENSWM